MATWDSVAPGRGWLGKEPPQLPVVGMQYGCEVINSLICCGSTVAYSGWYTQKVLESSWGKELCSESVLVYLHLRLSRAVSILMWWGLREGYTNHSHESRTTLPGDWPFSLVSFLYLIKDCLQHSFCFSLLHLILFLSSRRFLGRNSQFYLNPKVEGDFSPLDLWPWMMGS